MFRLALAFCLGLIWTFSANAQSTEKFLYTRQSCDPFEKIIGVVTGKYGEQPLFIGEGLQFGMQGDTYRGGAMFLVNQNTGTWSLLTLYGDGTACVTAVGTEFEPYSGPTNKVEGEKG
jgi:hypothetical protein